MTKSPERKPAEEERVIDASQKEYQYDEGDTRAEIKKQYLAKQIKRVGISQSVDIVDCFDDIEVPEVPISIRDKFIPTLETDNTEYVNSEDEDEHYGFIQDNTEDIITEDTIYDAREPLTEGKFTIHDYKPKKRKLKFSECKGFPFIPVNTNSSSFLEDKILFNFTIYSSENSFLM